MAGPGRAIARLDGLTHRHASILALDGVTLEIPGNCLVGLIGPDGVGKSSLLGIVAGAKRIQQGKVEVLGGDMADSRHRSAICPRIAYMPQGLGKNLYADLSVRENIEFFGRLFGQNRDERERRIASLLGGTGLAPFANRLAKNLSGGMRQKLGLCCSLIHHEAARCDRVSLNGDELGAVVALVPLPRRRRPLSHPSVRGGCSLTPSANRSS